jgi:hypothetical protein
MFFVWLVRHQPAAFQMPYQFGIPLANINQVLHKIISSIHPLIKRFKHVRFGNIADDVMLGGKTGRKARRFHKTNNARIGQPCSPAP